MVTKKENYLVKELEMLSRSIEIKSDRKTEWMQI